MKKYFTFLSFAAVLAFGACGGGKNSVDKDALQGKYEVDLSGMTDKKKSLTRDNSLQQWFL